MGNPHKCYDQLIVNSIKLFFLPNSCQKFQKCLPMNHPRPLATITALSVARKNNSEGWLDMMALNLQALSRRPRETLSTRPHRQRDTPKELKTDLEESWTMLLVP